MEQNYEKYRFWDFPVSQINSAYLCDLLETK